MGVFEIFQYWFLVIILTTIIILILSIFTYKNLLVRFGILSNGRREFYECGFKPIVQKPILLSIQFYILCYFFILYDIELAFSFPLVSLITEHSFLDFVAFSFIYSTFVISLFYDFDRNLTSWKL